MAAHVDALAGADGLRRDTDALELDAARRLERPDLGLIARALHFEVDPRMRIHEMHFPDDTPDIGKRRNVIAVGMVRLQQGRHDADCADGREGDPNTNYGVRSHATALRNS